MKARRVKRLDPAAPLEENAARIVAVRLDEMRSFTPAALDPANSVAQHDMRIAAKRLRYILEATGFCFGKPAQTAGRRARDLQGLLGEVHDCDVMLPVIDTHIADLRTEDAAAVRAKAGDATDPRPARSRRAPATAPPIAASRCSRSTCRRAGSSSSTASSRSGASRRRPAPGTGWSAR